MSLDNRTWFQKGLKDGIPIALGYFAVSFTLGSLQKTPGLPHYRQCSPALL